MNAAIDEAQRAAAPNILLVDDEEDILPEYQELLDLEGLDSITCSDPEQARDMVLAQSNIRLMVTDLRMAKLDGASLIKSLRAELPPTRRVEFIIISGDATWRIGDDMADVPVFIKPADTDALVGAIRAALGSRL